MSYGYVHRGFCVDFKGQGNLVSRCDGLDSKANVDVPVQALLDAEIIARDNVKASRKKMY